jgi:hypothetical protein
MLVRSLLSVTKKRLKRGIRNRGDRWRGETGCERGGAGTTALMVEVDNDGPWEVFEDESPPPEHSRSLN